MYGEVSTVDGRVAYFQPGGYKSVFAYSSTNNKWYELPECPNHGFNLAMVNSLLTAIGGKTPNYELTNSLLSLSGDKWTKQFPPMPTKRWLTAVLCSGRSLVVAGGVGEGNKNLSTVEVMKTETLQWSTASSLPHPLSKHQQHSVEIRFTCWEGLIRMDNQSQYSPAHWLPSSNLASHSPQ